MTSEEDFAEKMMRRTFTAFYEYYNSIQIRQASQRSLIVHAENKHKAILSSQGFFSQLENLLECADANQKVLQEILNKVDAPFRKEDLLNREVPEVDRRWVNLALVHIVREWSDSGAKERDESFGRLLTELNDIYPDRKARESIQVFVPGSKLARLPFVIATEGYNCSTNEESFFFLFIANFIVNHCDKENSYRIYPWLHDLSNRYHAADVTTPVSFPDINPSRRPENFQFQMVPGDFLDVSQNLFESQSMDCVVSAFFLETGHNVVKYVEEIRKLLKPNGYWINVGSLSYAYESHENELSIELPLSTLKKVIEEFGFKFIKDEIVNCSYCYNESSATHCSVKTHFFVCQSIDLGPISVKEY